MEITDYGPKPFVTNIEAATLLNDNYRSTLWTGKNLQVTVMAIQPGHDIGLEVHEITINSCELSKAWRRST
jgi:mannose-6-phosphate isomerase-like protein (cupin superfamily)